MITLESSVTELKGVGPAKAKALERAGIRTVWDLARHYPRAYQNRGDVKKVSHAAQICRDMPQAPPCSLVLTVATEPRTANIRRGMSLTKFKAFDESGAVDITYFNQPFVKNVFSVGAEFRFWGRMQLSGGRPTLANPVWEPFSEDAPLPPIVPVYPLSAGLSQKFLAGLIKEAVRAASLEIKEHIPSEILRENGLCTAAYALRCVHFPPDTDALSAARKRLAFDELFTLAAAMGSAKNGKAARGAHPCPDSDVGELLNVLPFSLTGAQKRSIGEISEDMKKDAPMCRILCGDVGSGKTAVAAAAAYIAVKNGTRCAIMAPTEILAKQHYADLSEIFGALGIETALLCGSMTAAEKRKVRESIAADGAPVVIGTHALLSDGVEFNNFGLVITDEQHRFGANQRALLREKTKTAHSLVMSATPIPRTLSLVIYGDLDVSRLDEMPPGRQKVGTFRVDESYRERLLGFIKKQASEGHRTYVVCPAIEETAEKTESAEEMCDILFMPAPVREPPVKAALPYTEELKRKLPELKIGFIHGKMKTAEKDETMGAFVRGELDVLVSTTVIEVGVNVPEATLMVVENAERFGLSQLHQLRGRVGRGKDKSYCILVSDTENETSVHRLETMCKMSDGFAIAEEDLKMRGPGDFFARGDTIRQSGAADLTFASSASPELTAKATEAAKKLLKRDPELALPEHEELRKTVQRLRRGFENTIN
ncbi:MAG: ATP-dependent DNA helicase RecG [Clostridia bacterium]|nr:ATP-dependent DNA helicase RecG [Clostridia bacterium]